MRTVDRTGKVSAQWTLNGKMMAFSNYLKGSNGDIPQTSSSLSVSPQNVNCSYPHLAWQEESKQDLLAFAGTMTMWWRCSLCWRWAFWQLHHLVESRQMKPNIKHSFLLWARLTALSVSCYHQQTSHFIFDGSMPVFTLWEASVLFTAQHWASRTSHRPHRTFNQYMLSKRMTVRQTTRNCEKKAKGQESIIPYPVWLQKKEGIGKKMQWAKELATTPDNLSWNSKTHQFW